METQGFIEIANNVSVILLLIIAVWWFNKQLEKAKAEARQDLAKETEKNEKLNERISEMEKNYLTAMDRNTQAMEKMTEAIDELKDELTRHKI